MEYQTFEIVEMEDGMFSIPELGRECETFAAAMGAIDRHCETLPVFSMATKRIVDYGFGGGAL